MTERLRTSVVHVVGEEKTAESVKVRLELLSRAKVLDRESLSRGAETADLLPAHVSTHYHGRTRHFWREKNP
jgi:hypothetical protein